MVDAMTYWASEDVYFSGDRFFAGLLADTEGARFSLDLETYIFEDDLLGRRVMESLVAAARRGVKVRVLVDGVGSPKWYARFAAELKAAGGLGRVYHPLPWNAPRSTSFSRRLLSPWAFARLLRVLNRRNHRKVLLVDGRVAWLGSMNISSVHLNSAWGAGAWRDTGIRVEGPAIRELETAFNRAWNVGRPCAEDDDRPVGRIPEACGLLRLNHCRRLRRRFYPELRQRMSRACQRIWITNPYFVPRPGMVRALRSAARRGVDVRVLVPGISDVFLVRWVSNAFYHSLLNAGVRIIHYKPRMLHAKVAMIDDWITVGSTNLNYRSLIHDLEVDAVVTAPAVRERIERQFEQDLSEGDLILLENWVRRSVWERLIVRIAVFLRYWC